MYRLRQYVSLTKPRVTQLTVFCALIGMCLATTNFPRWELLLATAAGIGLLASAAFAVNCIVERKIDAHMARTARRPTASGEITATQTFLFSALLGSIGAGILYIFVNPLTMWLTIATFIGYAVIYTLLLKPATPQNIVIGGLAGAMPPALGWAAVANAVPMQAWILVLIIFVWTPPHFWALALYRLQDYKKSGLPMLPVTHGAQFTRFHILLYSIVLTATTVLPFAVQMSGGLYLTGALVLDSIFLWHAWRVYRHYTDQIARKAFAYSITYLLLLFSALLIDHYLNFQ